MVPRTSPTPFKSGRHANINTATGAFKSPIETLTDFTAKVAAAKDGSIGFLSAQRSDGPGCRETSSSRCFKNFAADMARRAHKDRCRRHRYRGAEHRQAEAFNRAFDAMKLVATRLQEQVFNILGQALVPIMDAFTEGNDEENGDAFRAWASDVTASVLPVVHDLINYFSGGAAPRRSS